MKILVVCTGNICRSPTGEGVLRHVAPSDWHIESCGVSDYHIGESPDERAIVVAENYGIDISEIRARQLCHDDFYNFDYILAMDSGHLEKINLAKPVDAVAEVRLYMVEDVPDPYYGDIGDFEKAFALIYVGGQAFVNEF